jgi:Phage integrase, N-terminal SAM-like domain
MRPKLPVSPRTEEAYYACVRQLSEFYGKSPELISAEEIRQHCIHLTMLDRSSHCQSNFKLSHYPRFSFPERASGCFGL